MAREMSWELEAHGYEALLARKRSGFHPKCKWSPLNNSKQKEGKRESYIEERKGNAHEGPQRHR